MFPLTANFLSPWRPHSSSFIVGKARRGMLRRAVFSDIQRKGLERRFQVQKYISKPDRKKLADQLGLKDSQVRNRKRMDFNLQIKQTNLILLIRLRFGFKIGGWNGGTARSASCYLRGAPGSRLCPARTIRTQTWATPWTIRGRRPVRQSLLRQIVLGVGGSEICPPGP